MIVSGIQIEKKQVVDVIGTVGFVFFALVVPGYIQMHYGISAFKLTIMITLLYLTAHLILEHSRWHLL